MSGAHTMLWLRTSAPKRSGSWFVVCRGESMQQNIDLIDLLRALNDERAKYLIIGAYAFAFHGRPRATKDVDLFIGCDSQNAARVWRALKSFGAPLDALREADLASAGTFFIMGRPPNQIDLITSIDGVSFEDSWATRVESMYGGVPVYYIGRDALIANKKASARPQDLADVAYLEETVRE